MSPNDAKKVAQIVIRKANGYILTLRSNESEKSPEEIVSIWGKAGIIGWMSREEIVVPALAETEGVSWLRDGWLRTGGDTWEMGELRNEGEFEKEITSGSWIEEKGKALWESFLLAEDSSSNGKSRGRREL